MYVSVGYNLKISDGTNDNMGITSLMLTHISRMFTFIIKVAVITEPAMYRRSLRLAVFCPQWGQKKDITKAKIRNLESR
ncbi:hypothetical protein CK934_09320 [Chitinophaga sp. MD30]|nr:hypothetical protein CK934_09320 [Chitinophaga sp. MD30]